ncbi:MAG: tryptophan--tRNA ligase [Gammaproteobacteria bacterium]|nr:tryptophan--tRNA ligase [Gammaproteobacteria bacterium]
MDKEPVKTAGASKRIVSGMRPTGGLHLGNYHGALKNWVALQHEHECFFFVADWHALTTDYENPARVGDNLHEMIVDWLAAGLDASVSTLFVQSRIPEHAELHLLLSMITPVPWLERVPSYKNQQQKLKEKDLSTFGFLGYPLLQSADILMYKPAWVPVGEDQVAHVELTREVARRFNHLYGREADFERQAERAAERLGAADGASFRELRRRHQEQGEAGAVEAGRKLIVNHAGLRLVERERLLGYLEGSSRSILVPPEVLLTKTPKFPGLDGQKMSKSYGNTIAMREDPDAVVRKLRTMQTDPARVRRTDPGEPEKCPVWDLHKVYSDTETQEWVQWGCRSAGIGCVECKAPVTERIVAEISGFRERAREYEANPGYVRDILARGNERAREVARTTMDEVREAMRLDYV